MTKQEEVRDSVILTITKVCPQLLNRHVVKLADAVLKDEDSKGVVIKVERELPLVISSYGVDRYGETIYISNEALNEAGYEAVESLMIEDSSKCSACGRDRYEPALDCPKGEHYIDY